MGEKPADKWLKHGETSAVIGSQFKPLMSINPIAVITEPQPPHSFLPTLVYPHFFPFFSIDGWDATRSEPRGPPITRLSYQVAPLLRCREVSRSLTYLLEFVTVSDSQHDAEGMAMQGMRLWDKMEKREGNTGCLTENKASWVAETTFWDSRDVPGAVKGKKKCRGLLQSLV